jgi:hypothetical protein
LLVFVIELVSWRESFSQPAGLVTLIEGAKKEGRVVWYATLNISDSNALLSRFEQKYPFIKTELLRAGSEQPLNRILTEDSAGRSALDLVNLTTINALKNAASYRPIARRKFRLIRSHSRMRRAIGQLSTIFTMLSVTTPR